MKKSLLLAVICLSCISAFSQTIIGNTTYDVQTNNGSKNRAIVYDDGSVSAVWVGSTEPDAGLGFSDRGTFYNHTVGGVWGAAPTSRIETVRTGFSELLKVEDHEVAISHYSIDGSSFNMRLFANDAIGSTSWTELSGSAVVSGLWSFSYCPEGTDDIYMVSADNGLIITQLYFSRSDDGGQTWTVLDQVVPYLTTADGIPNMSGAAESYQIAAHGSDVYILFGMPTSDLVLLHSSDYGNEGTWERTNIIDFPYDNFDGLVQTDIDGDFITDTLGTTDSYHEMLMMDDGTVHVFSGYQRIYSDGFGYILNYKASGIWHWSTGMAAAELINTETDWSSPDCVYAPYAGIGAYVYNYRNAAASSEPAATYDPSTGRIYLLFTKKLEYTDIYADPTNFSAESYRDIFGCYSDDGGATWTTPNNLTNTAESQRENFFVFTSEKTLSGKICAVWQEDSMPGHFNEGDIVHKNNIMFNTWSDADFIAPVAVPDYDYTVDLFLVTFTDASSGASCYSWDFGDGGTSTLANPTHTYATGGTYTACLMVSNSYGSETYCQDITLVTAPGAAFSYTGDPDVSFTDLSSNTPTSWSWDFDDGGTSTEQNPSHTFADNGLYNVCLTATNLGGSNTACENVAINLAVQAPVVDFNYTSVGTAVSFNDLSTNTPTSWSWDFDDGATSTLQSPSHTYASGGTYNVCLSAGNAGGTGSKCHELTVVTGIFDNADNYLTLYPNPATDFITISSDMDLSDVVFELYNAAGQKAAATIKYTSSTQLTIEVKDLAAGTYMLKITNDNGTESRMITVE